MLNERLAQLRLRAGLEQRVLSRLAGLKSEGAVFAIESGAIKDPQGSTVVRLAKVLGTSADYLIAGTGLAPSDEALKAAVTAAREQPAAVESADTQEAG